MQQIIGTFHLYILWTLSWIKTIPDYVYFALKLFNLETPKVFITWHLKPQSTAMFVFLRIKLNRQSMPIVVDRLFYVDRCLMHQGSMTA